MINKLRKECMVYILIFCFNQITIVGVNPFGLAMAAAAIGNGYNIIMSILATFIGNILIYDYNVISNLTILIILGTFEYMMRKYNKPVSEITKSMMLLLIFCLVRVGRQYQDIYFISILLIILEALIVSCFYIVVGSGQNYIVMKDIFKEMGLQEKISLSVIMTLFGVYIIQVRKENVSFLKVVIIYVLSFILTLVYKSLLSKNNNKLKQKNNIYNNLIYNKLVEYSDAIQNMAKSIGDITSNERDVETEEGSSIFEKLSEKYCVVCDRCNYCWEKEYDNSYGMINTMMKKGVENGVLTLEDIPKKFMIKCRKSSEMINETNINLQLSRNNIWWQSKVDEMKKIMAMELMELSNSVRDFSMNMYHNVLMGGKTERRIKYALKQLGIMAKEVYCYEHRNIKEIVMVVRAYGGGVKTIDAASEVSDVLQEKYKPGDLAPKIIYKKDVEINLVREETYSVRTSVVCIKKDGEEYSGDYYSIIDEDILETVMIISDGMGSGKSAYEESKKAIEMGEELFCAGFSREVIMNLANLSSYMNYGKSDMYSTLDICVFNKYTGMAEFMKMGATLSYIKRGNDVIEILSDTLPLGVFDNTEYDRKQIALENGDVVIMMTDGLEDSISTYLDWRDEIIYIIKNILSSNPKTIADYIVISAVGEGNIVDDITVLVGVVWDKNIK